MQGRVLYVSPHNNGWLLHFEHENVGDSFGVKSSAVNAAREKVKANPEGYIRQIRVQKMDGKFETEWTYGPDPYPPKG